jgi:hypothetical protein
LLTLSLELLAKGECEAYEGRLKDAGLKAGGEDLGGAEPGGLNELAAGLLVPESPPANVNLNEPLRCSDAGAEALVGFGREGFVGAPALKAKVACLVLKEVVGAFWSFRGGVTVKQFVLPPRSLFW